MVALNMGFSFSLIQPIPIRVVEYFERGAGCFFGAKCAAAKKAGNEKNLADHESRIDTIVYELFQFTTEEIGLLES